nr:MAG TPA: hypothetical protein [Caudoviricetes sp.]
MIGPCMIDMWRIPDNKVEGVICKRHVTEISHNIWIAFACAPHAIFKFARILVHIESVRIMFIIPNLPRATACIKNRLHFVFLSFFVARLQ